MSFWGVATALSATVRQQAAQVISAVQETDWRAELNAFQEELLEETEELTAEARETAQDLVARAKQVSDQIPGSLDQLPEQARGPGAGGGGWQG